MGLIVATKAFFKLMFNRELSDSFQQLLDHPAPPKIESPTPATPTMPAPTPQPARSDAITLLASLQREARLIDIVKEPLDQYTDAQVGAAARDVLQKSEKVLDRMFGLMPLTTVADGSPLETPSQIDPSEYRLTGNVSGEGPFRGTVAHHGWKASRCEVPEWSGRPESAMIIAPIELEIS